MRIVSISIVRNEADIIETFVRYHLRIVDHMIVISHRSVDDTLKILKMLKQEGLKIEVEEEHSIDQPQSRALTRAMMRAVREFDADWVLPLDADEFLVAEKNANAKDLISEFDDGSIVNVAWRTYIPRRQDDNQEPIPIKRIRFRKKTEDVTFTKVMIPRKIALDRAIIGFGSHTVKRKSVFARKRRFNFVNAECLFLAHFPVRSLSQIESKAYAGWLACLARGNRGSGDNFHLKLLFDEFAEGRVFDGEDLCQIAMGYGTSNQNRASNSENLIECPILSSDSSFELRYPAGVTSNPRRVLATLAEEFASAIADKRVFK